jgi:hypothetical protein
MREEEGECSPTLLILWLRRGGGVRPRKKVDMIRPVPAERSVRQQSKHAQMVKVHMLRRMSLRTASTEAAVGAMM